MSTHESFRFGHESAAHYTLTSPQGRPVDISVHRPRQLTEVEADKVVDLLLTQFSEKLFSIVDQKEEFSSHDRADMRIYKPGKYATQKERVRSFRIYLNIAGEHKASVRPDARSGIHNVRRALEQAFSEWAPEEETSDPGRSGDDARLSA